MLTNQNVSNELSTLNYVDHIAVQTVNEPDVAIPDAAVAALTDDFLPQGKQT